MFSQLLICTECFIYILTVTIFIVLYIKMKLSKYWQRLTKPCNDLSKMGSWSTYLTYRFLFVYLKKVLRRVLTTTGVHPTVSEPTWSVILEEVAVQQTVKVMHESTMVAREDVDIHPLSDTGRRCISKVAMWTVNCTANMFEV